MTNLDMVQTSHTHPSATTLEVGALASSNEYSGPESNTRNTTLNHKPQTLNPKPLNPKPKTLKPPRHCSAAAAKTRRWTQKPSDPNSSEWRFQDLRRLRGLLCRANTLHFEA